MVESSELLLYRKICELQSRMEKIIFYLHVGSCHLSHIESGGEGRALIKFAFLSTEEPQIISSKKMSLPTLC